MLKNCLICQRIREIIKNTNPYFVSELETGYVVMADYQLFRGYAIFLCKEHKNELHQLKTDFKRKFLEETSLVAEAVFRAFKPKKLNYELLGNKDAHLHWHIIPRYRDDPKPLEPIWSLSPRVRNLEKYKPAADELECLKSRLRSTLCFE